ncbi:hypothetical protein R6Q57_024599 [Mikania cordata]
MEHTLPHRYVTKEMKGFVKQEEETSFMESPKRESSEWTDEKHSLYLYSMEASFIDKLYNSLDTQCWQAQNECSSDSMSSRKIHTSVCCPSGQFKVLRHGFWSRVDFRRENLVHNEANRPHVLSSNPWIQHFRSGNRHEPIQSPSHPEKPSLTSCSNTEMMDQNFIEEDSAMQLMNTTCSKKKRKVACAVSESGNEQVAASFGHFSYKRNH